MIRELLIVPNISGIPTDVLGSLPVQAEHYGPWIYLLIFVIILFASSFVVTPFPGNSLLFVSGALATTHQFELSWLFFASSAAAYIGYDVNYWSGRLLGIAVCRQGCPGVFEENNIKKTLDLMKRYGAVSVIISRFVPAVNLPPFFAGMDAMNYRLYSCMNLAGAVIWSALILSAGYLFGGIPSIQAILPVLLAGVIVILCISFVIAAIMLVKGYYARKKGAAG